MFVCKIWRDLPLFAGLTRDFPGTQSQQTVGPAEAWPFNRSGSRAGDAGTDGAGFPVQMVGGCTRYGYV